MRSSAIWLITGPPAIGKSTVISKVVLALRTRGYIVGGCLTKEAKRNGVRVGFTIHDLMGGTSAELASTGSMVGPRLGKYRVSLTNLSLVGASSLRRAAGEAELIVIDEVGPMELMSPEFRRAVEACYKSPRPILAVVHERMKDPLIELLVSDPMTKSFEVSLHNREGTVADLSAQIVAALGPLKDA
ncbi:MAG: NTPase [Thaumarchaeota archaeon]|nr:NTPase [Nitrososphaerota archaeon]